MRHIVRILLTLFVLALAPAGMAQQQVRCALITNDLNVLDYEFFPSECPPDPTGKGWSWVPAPVAQPPEHDPATQVVEGPVIQVTADAVTEVYTVRNLTAQEQAALQDQRKEGLLSGVQEFSLRRLCDHESRLRVLEGKSAITWEQCRQAIKDAL